MINAQVLRLNGTRVTSLAQLAQLVESSRERFLRFELDRDEAVVIDREGARAEAAEILRTHSIPAAASPDILAVIKDSSSSGAERPSEVGAPA